MRIQATAKNHLLIVKGAITNQSKNFSAVYTFDTYRHADSVLWWADILKYNQSKLMNTDLGLTGLEPGTQSVKRDYFA